MKHFCDRYFACDKLIKGLYKINKDYYSLFENQQQDGYELNEPPSNVINAFGVFSAFASDSTFFEISRE